MEYALDNTRLLVSHFKACFLFYQNIMGFKATYGDENDNYAAFDTGGAKLALFGRSDMSEAIGNNNLPADARCQDRFCLIFSVENVDATCQKLKSQGIPFVTEPMDRASWGIRTAHFRDPDGNLIEIMQGLPQV